MSALVFRRNFTKVPTFANCFRKFSTEKVPKNYTNMKDLTDQLAEHTGETKTSVRKILSALPIVIRESLGTGNDVKLHRVATFRHVQAAARTMTHVKTKEKYNVPERTAIRARLSGFLKK